jgi:WS/DGAT/MGAT family acyltransferase
MQLAFDVGPAPMQVGAVLELEAGVDLAAARAVLADRIAAVPRLRQVLMRPPPGCGRPVWVDDARFDLGHHVRQVTCPGPGDERALGRLAAAIVAEPLSFARPLWVAVLVTGLARGEAALVIVFHHVMADGVGGMALLSRLVDGVAPGEGPPFPLPPPSWRRLAEEATRQRLRTLRRLPTTLARIWKARRGLRPPPTHRPAATSLTRRTGTIRDVLIARVPLAAVVATAHRVAGSVNDVVLAAVGGALGALLEERGEVVDRLVVSVPVSARTAGTVDLGNRVGVMPVPLPTGGDRRDRLTEIAALTAARKEGNRRSSPDLLQPLFRGLAALGLMRPLIDRQRLVDTLVTNVRGPGDPVTILGRRVTAIVPVANVTGNVPLAFAVLSYAGALTVAVVVDPVAVPDAERLTMLLQAELNGLIAQSEASPPPR